MHIHFLHPAGTRNPDKRTILRTAFAFCMLLSGTKSALSQYHHDSIKTNHGYLHYYTKGKGSPVVLLQGGPGFSHHYFRGVSDSIEGYKFVLIDYMGTGNSIHTLPDLETYIEARLKQKSMSGG